LDVTYTNSDIYDKNDKLNFLQKKWSEWKSKSLNVSSQYKFGYSFPLDRLVINNLNDGKILITISQKDLDLKYIEEISDKTVLSADYGIFAKDFTPQEIQAIKSRTDTKLTNTLRSNRQLRDASTENLKEIITDMAKEFGFEYIKIEINPDFLIDNKEVSLKDITY
jgi:hypothetical protein